jgi:3,4-dihydroxy 2-butanone 4-phosphate synthase / GTP cyclohydrolase II
MTAIRLDTVPVAVEALRRGLPVLVADDADRENEGDVILAAEHADPTWIGWTVRHSSGVLCAPMSPERADALHLPAMVEDNEDPRRTAYTVSTDARTGVTTGIGAADRARTLRLLADPATTPHDLVRPGHIFPLRAVPGGVLARRGHTEAAVDLCRLAGLAPVGVIAELVGDDGEPLRLPSLRSLADVEGLPLITVEDLAAWRRSSGDEAVEAVGSPAQAPAAARVERVTRADLPTRHGRFEVVGYRDRATGAEHVALVADGTADLLAVGEDLPVRVHSECLTGDVLGSVRCDCGPQLVAALQVAAERGGVVIYLRGHEGRGIGLLAKLRAYALQDGGLDTVAANLEQGLPADAREYGAAAAILKDLGVGRVRLLTNNPSKVTGLADHGVEVTERVPLTVTPGEYNLAYLVAKRDLMGHLLGALEEDAPRRTPSMSGRSMR